MFNISFGELLIIGAIGVIVIGPARLPQTARFIGHFIGRAQRQVAAVKAEIKREMEVEDMKSAQRDYEEATRNLRNVFNQAASGVSDAAGEAQKSIAEAQAAATGAPAEGNFAAEDKSAEDKIAKTEEILFSTKTAAPAAPAPTAQKGVSFSNENENKNSAQEGASFFNENENKNSAPQTAPEDSPQDNTPPATRK